jgi:hypothetical protein
MRDQLQQAIAAGAAETAPEDVAAAAAALDHMEALAEGCVDVGAWSTQLAVQNLWATFTEPFTRALGAAGAARYGGHDGALPDDETMLARTVGAYEAAIGQSGGPGAAHIDAVLAEVVELGRSGLSYPRFLFELEVRGLTQVLAGLTVPPREELVAQIEHHRAQRDSSRAGCAAAVLEVRDALRDRNRFGAIEPLEWELARGRVEWEWAPRIARDDAVVQRVQRLFMDLGDWVDAFTAAAPSDERWAGPTPAATRANIERTRECIPVFFRVRERIVAEGLGLRWADVALDPTFPRARLHMDQYLSDERVALALAVEPSCVPGGSPPAELVGRAAALLRR